MINYYLRKQIVICQVGDEGRFDGTHQLPCHLSLVLNLISVEVAHAAIGVVITKVRAIRFPLLLLVGLATTLGFPTISVDTVFDFSLYYARCLCEKELSRLAILWDHENFTVSNLSIAEHF